MTEREKLCNRIFSLLSQKYIQRSDDRQKAMGLQYTTAETHDLATTLANFIINMDSTFETDRGKSA